MSDQTTMNCEEAIRLLAEYLDGELHDDMGAAVEHHLTSCRGCFSRAEFEKRLRAQLGQLARRQVPAAFEERIRSLIGRFSV